MNHQQDHDPIRAKFTKWLDTLICNARIDYLRKAKRSVEIISFEDISEYNLPVATKDIVINTEKTEFDFEEERLAQAFYQLPLMKQKILTMLFVEDKKPEEISQALNCSAQYVYNQRYGALKKLRQILDKGGDDI